MSYVYYAGNLIYESASASVGTSTNSLRVNIDSTRPTVAHGMGSGDIWNTRAPGSGKLT